MPLKARLILIPSNFSPVASYHKTIYLLQEDDLNKSKFGDFAKECYGISPRRESILTRSSHSSGAHTGFSCMSLPSPPMLTVQQHLFRSSAQTKSFNVWQMLRFNQNIRLAGKCLQIPHSESTMRPWML